MKRKRVTRFIAALLTFAMLIQEIPVFAADTTEQSDVATASENVTVTETEAAEEPVTIVAEEDSLRGEREKHFRMSDGSYIAVSYNDSIHYQDDSGSWKEIDNRLTEKKDSKGKTFYKSGNKKTPVSFMKIWKMESF